MHESSVKLKRTIAKATRMDQQQRWKQQQQLLAEDIINKICCSIINRLQVSLKCLSSPIDDLHQLADGVVLVELIESYEDSIQVNSKSKRLDKPIKLQRNPLQRTSAANNLDYIEQWLQAEGIKIGSKRSVKEMFEEMERGQQEFNEFFCDQSRSQSSNEFALNLLINQQHHTIYARSVAYIAALCYAIITIFIRQDHLFRQTINGYDFQVDKEELLNIFLYTKWKLAEEELLMKDLELMRMKDRYDLLELKLANIEHKSNVWNPTLTMKNYNTNNNNIIESNQAHNFSHKDSVNVHGLRKMSSLDAAQYTDTDNRKKNRLKDGKRTESDWNNLNSLVGEERGKTVENSNESAFEVAECSQTNQRGKTMQKSKKQAYHVQAGSGGKSNNVGNHNSHSNESANSLLSAEKIAQLSGKNASNIAKNGEKRIAFTESYNGRDSPNNCTNTESIDFHLNKFQTNKGLNYNDEHNVHRLRFSMPIKDGPVVEKTTPPNGCTNQKPSHTFTGNRYVSAALKRPEHQSRSKSATDINFGKFDSSLGLPAVPSSSSSSSSSSRIQKRQPITRETEAALLLPETKSTVMESNKINGVLSDSYQAKWRDTDNHGDGRANKLNQSIKVEHCAWKQPVNRTPPNPPIKRGAHCSLNDTTSSSPEHFGQSYSNVVQQSIGTHCPENSLNHGNHQTSSGDGQINRILIARLLAELSYEKRKNFHHSGSNVFKLKQTNTEYI